MRYQAIFIILILFIMLLMALKAIDKGKEILINQDKQLQNLLKGDF